MSQFTSYKKETQKNKSSKKRQTAIGGLDLEGLKSNLTILQDENIEPFQPKKKASQKVAQQKENIESGHGLAIAEQQVGAIPSDSEIVQLTKIQRQVYQFFLDNGAEGTFNRTMIVKKASVTLASVKASIVKFQKYGMIELGKLCPSAKIQTYRLNTNVGVSGHKMDSVQTISRGIEISEFWKNAGLTHNKCDEWIGEISGLDPERLQVQLEYGEHTEAVRNAKKGSISYLYGCLKKEPLTKPAGYRTTEDKYAAVMTQRIQEEEEKSREIEKLKEKLFDAQYKTWCLENPNEVKEIHEGSTFKSRDINSVVAQTYIKSKYKKKINS